MQGVDKKQLAIVKGQVTKAENIAKSLSIKSDDDYKLAGKKYLEIKKLEREFNKEYNSWMKPINELRDKVFAVSRPMKARFKHALDTLGQAMTEYEDKVEAERMAKAAKLEQAVEKGDLDLATATDQAGHLATVDPVETEKGKLGAQIRHELVIIDTDKLARKFMQPDMPKIREYYQATGILPEGVQLQKRVVRTARIA